MSRVEDWLKSSDLSHLAQVFLDNEIDIDILLDLSDDDLREMGLSLGVRKRFRAAIDRVPMQDTSHLNATQSHPASGAERRHLTIMFVDLVGSTALSSTMDPEDMRDVITHFQNVVSGVVNRYGGQVAKYMGDGVLCYFGWPRAHEDDAERSVRTALEIVGDINRFPSKNGLELAVRIGVATGLVVVGDLIGKGGAQEEAVVGDTPNLAARLQQHAAPGEVIIAERTRQLIGEGFEILDIGELVLKGLEKSGPAFRVVAERSLPSRYEASTQAPQFPMVGRDHELGLVLDRWFRAERGEGQVSVLIGEAGIGKSRLTQAIIEAVQSGPHFRINYHCSPYHSDSSFFPMIQQLLHLADIQPGDSIKDRRRKLDAHLLAADTSIIAALIDPDDGAGYGALDLSPQQFRNRVFESMSDEIRALSKEKPALIVVEDAHWIDASTLAALEACFDKISSERVLILITARPTFVHRFGAHPIVSHLTLNRLGIAQAAAISGKIAGGKSLPDELVRAIVARTDGVPLFVEELTKTILESGELKETENSYQLTGPLSRMTIPATLHDSLMARIDRLQPIKEIAQIAACIGREFDRQTLLEISKVDGPMLDDALSQLETAELVFRRVASSEPRFVFKHALVRDVAYESLLKSRRQNIHERIFRLFDVDDEVSPEVVAYHATQAELRQDAIRYWKQAGAVAQARPAYDEAVNHFKAAISLVETLLDQPEWAEKHLKLLLQLSQIYIAKEGYASKEASETFAKSLEKIDATTSSELRVAVYYGTWIAPYISGRVAVSFEHANRLVEEMEAEDDPIPRLISHRMRAASLISMGRSPEALEDLKMAYELYRSVDLGDFTSKFAQDPGVQIQCYQLLAMWMCGEHSKAVALGEEAIEKARILQHANTFCYAGLHVVTLSIWIGDIDRAREINEQMRQIAFDHDMALWKVFCGLHDQVIGCMSDDPEAIASLPGVIEGYVAAGCGLWITLYRVEYAKALLRKGDVEGAQATIDQTFTEIADSAEHWADAELLRIRGEVFCALGDISSANSAFNDAIKIARSQNARMLELRAAVSMARSIQVGQSSKELATALSWFGPEETGPDLMAAREVMALNGVGT